MGGQCAARPVRQRVRRKRWRLACLAAPSHSCQQPPRSRAVSWLQARRPGRWHSCQQPDKDSERRAGAAGPAASAATAAEVRRGQRDKSRCCTPGQFRASRATCASSSCVTPRRLSLRSSGSGGRSRRAAAPKPRRLQHAKLAAAAPASTPSASSPASRAHVKSPRSCQLASSSSSCRRSSCGSVATPAARPLPPAPQPSEPQLPPHCWLASALATTRRQRCCSDGSGGPAAAMPTCLLSSS